MAPLSYYGFLVSVVSITSDNGTANAWTTPKALTRRQETRLNYAEEKYSRQQRSSRDEYYQGNDGYYPEQDYSYESENQGYGQHNGYEYDNQRGQAMSPQENFDYQGYDDQYGYERQAPYQQRRDDEYYRDRRVDSSMNGNQDHGGYNDGYGEQKGQALVPQENYDDYQRYDDNPYGYDNRDYEQQRRESDDYYAGRRAGGSLSRPNSWFEDPFFSSPFSRSPFPSMLSPMFGASMLDSFFSPFSSPFGRNKGSLSPFARMDAMMEQMMGPSMTSMGDMVRQQQEQMRAQTENIQDLLDEALSILQNDPVVQDRVPGPIDAVEGNPIFSQSSSSAMVVDVNGEQRQTQRTEFGVRLNNNQWSLWLATEGGRLQEVTLVDNTDPTNPINVAVPGAEVDGYNAQQQLPGSDRDEADPTRAWRNVLPSPSNNERPSRPRRKMDNDDDVIDVEAVEV